jgi:hypothetical protein
MQMLTNILQSWKAFLLIQGLGTLMVLIGAATNVATQVIGLAMLLPGSAMAAIIPYRWFDLLPALGRLTKSDAAGISNVIYLPCAVLINAAVFYLVRKALRSRANRAASLNPQVKNSEA